MKRKKAERGLAMPRVVVSSDWGRGTVEDVAYVDEMWLANEIFDALAKRYSANPESGVESVRRESIGGKVLMEWKRKK